MTPKEYQEQQKARIYGMYSNTNEVLEKAPVATETNAAAPATPAPAATEVKPAETE